MIAALCAHITQQGRPVGFGTFADRGERFVHPAFHAAQTAKIDMRLRIFQQPADFVRPVSHEVLHIDLGLAGKNEGVALLESGATSLGGRIPVNPSGGLLRKGHPIGASGAGQVVELVDQLRGRCGPRQVSGARTAMAENGGGFIGKDVAAIVISVLQKE